MTAYTTPSEIARETLRTLATRKIAPTPDNYSRVYQEIGGGPTAAGGATKVLTEVAQRLTQESPKSAPIGQAMKQAIGFRFSVGGLRFEPFAIVCDGHR